MRRKKESHAFLKIATSQDQNASEPDRYVNRLPVMTL